MTKEHFVEKSTKKLGNKFDYSLIENFIHKNDMVKITCPVHGEFEQRVYSHMAGHGCTKCKYEKLSKINDLQRSTLEIFISKARQLHGDKYDYSKSVYKSSNDKIEIICPIHGSFFHCVYEHIGKRKYGCPKCSKSKKMTLDEFIEKSRKIHNNYYSYEKSVLTRVKNKIIITCPIHGDFSQEAYSHTIGVGCKYCKSSHGEKRIAEFLNDQTIKYEEQYSILECRYKWPLKFDFAIKNENDELIFLIEYQGQQHYMPVRFGGMSIELANDMYEKQTIKDKIKVEYCRDNNIKLLIIKYSDYKQIKQIIKTFITKELKNGL